MKGYNFTDKQIFEGQLPTFDPQSQVLIICNSNEIYDLVAAFDLDEDTVDECTNLDEVIRYTSYDDYDFISLIYTEIITGELSLCEVNVFFSHNFLAFVVPEKPGKMLSKLEQKLMASIKFASTRPEPLNYLYYVFFDKLATDFAELLEHLEDDMEELSERIEHNPNTEQSVEIGAHRKKAYTYKKLLRSLSYIGSQINVDENDFLADDLQKYFRNIATRFAKLYDFSNSLNSLAGELLSLYDSKFAAQTNKALNKLTVITLFFGPMTVIAGIYGMNFVHMPELKWMLGYPFALGLMLLVSTIIYIVLKKKKWL